MTSTLMSIGRLARRAGVNVETVRYYQRRGLVAEPPKPMYGFRYYPEDTVTRVRFIKRAQRLGFTLKEIGELLMLGDGHCEDVREMATRKHARIEARIADLAAMKRVLEELLGSCRSRRNRTGCPIVESLSSRDEDGPTSQRTKEAVRGPLSAGTSAARGHEAKRLDSVP